MGGLLFEKLKAEYGEPRRKDRAVIAGYIRDNAEEIKQALDRGYTRGQLAAVIGGVLGCKVSEFVFGYYYKKLKEEAEGGYLVEYAIGQSRRKTWREFADRKAVETFVEDMAARESAKAGYKVAGVIVSVKKMTRKAYERANGKHSDS